jgi:hypothetical protein
LATAWALQPWRNPFFVDMTLEQGSVVLTFLSLWPVSSSGALGFRPRSLCPRALLSCGPLGEVSLVGGGLGDELFVEDLFGLLEASVPVPAPQEGGWRLVRAVAGRLGVGERALDQEFWEFQSGTAGVHDPLTRSHLLREVAHELFGSAFAGLREAGVIPTSRHELDRYLQVGRENDGGDVFGPETDALGATLGKL